MALVTIPVALSHGNLQQYLSKLDDLGRTYSFDVSGGNKLGQAIDLELTVEGCSNPLLVQLLPNGTWSAKHVVVVGEDE